MYALTQVCPCWRTANCVYHIVACVGDTGVTTLTAIDTHACVVWHIRVLEWVVEAGQAVGQLADQREQVKSGPS